MSGLQAPVSREEQLDGTHENAPEASLLLSGLWEGVYAKCAARAAHGDRTREEVAPEPSGESA